MDIQKSNYGYPKFKIIFGYPKIHLSVTGGFIGQTSSGLE